MHKVITKLLQVLTNNSNTLAHIIFSRYTVGSGLSLHELENVHLVVIVSG